MKKSLSFILACLMALSAASCTSAPAASTAGTASGADESSTAAAEGGDAESSTEGDTESAEGGETESDLAYVQDKGTLVVGITYFDPMDYKEEGSDEWVGFDADMAKAFAESLGVDVEFSEITWDYKVEELDSKAIDAVWNGMTLTDDVTSAMSTSEPYCLNAQVLVAPADKAAGYEGLTSLDGLTVAVESGSAGEEAATALGATTVPVQSQAAALMEVDSQTSDVAVIDLLMAGAMIGEGTSYADLTQVANLNEMQDLPDEEYGVGFRKGSDLTDAFNEFWAEKVADGTVLEVATTYGLQDSVILD